MGRRGRGSADAFVYNAATGGSDLGILDAATLGTVVAIHLPHRVPFGFHGNWIPPSTNRAAVYRSAAAEASLTVSGSVKV
jgi:Retinal pigment epithelial membrane protein